MGWQDVLLSADVLWSPVVVGRIRLELPSGIQQELRLASVQGPLYPRAAGRLVSESSEPTLIIADSASRDVVELVRRSGQSIVTASGRVLLQLATETVEGDASRVTRPARARGPKPWGRLTVVRRLLQAGPLTQTALAELAGLSQERVSRILAPLHADGLVVRASGGEGVPDPEALLDWWLGIYPPEPGLVAYYYANDDVRSQLDRVVAAHAGRRFLLSGDLAADHLAPWRLPAQVLLYCANPADLALAGFVPAGAQEATVGIVVSPDPGVYVPSGGEAGDSTASWAHMDTRSGPIELADPLQILRDVLSAPGADARDAATVLRTEVTTGRTAARLRTWLLSGLIRTQPSPLHGGRATSC